MTRVAAIAIALLAAVPAGAFERLGVVAVADPPAGPDADLAELAHQLRAACRDRVGGVEDVPTMRAHLLGQTSNATLSELDRAYGGALAVYQNGEFESALRTLHAIVEDLESLPESADAYSQWVRAQLRLAHAAITVNRESEADDALFTLAKTDLAIGADPGRVQMSTLHVLPGTDLWARARALGLVFDEQPPLHLRARIECVGPHDGRPTSRNAAARASAGARSAGRRPSRLRARSTRVNMDRGSSHT